MHKNRLFNRILCLILAVLLFLTLALSAMPVRAEGEETNDTDAGAGSPIVSFVPENADDSDGLQSSPDFGDAILIPSASDSIDTDFNGDTLSGTPSNSSDQPIYLPIDYDSYFSDDTGSSLADAAGFDFNALNGLSLNEDTEDEEALLDAQELNDLPEPPSGVYGSGSYQLNKKAGDQRFFSEYFIYNDSKHTYQTAGINRQTQLHVYLKQGETIYFGSSTHRSCITVNDTLNASPDVSVLPANNPNFQPAKVSQKDNVDAKDYKTYYTTGADIVMIKPDSTRVAYDVIKDGQGYIATPTQEMNGPQLNQTDRDADAGKAYNSKQRYEPLTFTADSTGTYTFLLHSYTGWNTGTVPSNIKNNVVWDSGDPGASAYQYVAAWDFTVVGQNSEGTGLEVKPGRMWADYLSLYSAIDSSKKDVYSSMDVHVLTDDGYIYEANFDEIVPYGFIFFANNMGFTTTGDTKYSVYHSFYDNDNSLGNMANEEKITIRLPNAANTATEKNFKIFFNKPGEDLPASIRPEIKAPSQITNLKLQGTSDGVSGVSHYMQGGTFTFTAPQGVTSVTIEIDLRGSLEKLIAADPTNQALLDYAKKGSGVIVLNGAANYGENSFSWDGTDSAGQYVPIGLYSRSDIKVYSEEKAGEIHFPLIDLEGMYGGAKFQRLNGGNAAGGNTAYDIYYNNNPLVYGTIEGKGAPTSTSGSYYVLSDQTRSYNYSSSATAGPSYFKGTGNVPAYNASTMLDNKYISTLVKDDRNYVSQQRYGRNFDTLTAEEQDVIKLLIKDDREFLAQHYYQKNYSQLDAAAKKLIDAEMASAATYHHEPVDSSQTSPLFSHNGWNGGANNGGLDIWTYYTPGIHDYDGGLDFAVMNSDNLGSITGTVFYDGDRNAKYEPNIVNGADQPLRDVLMELVDRDGNPITHEVDLPVFDDDGYFVYGEDGQVLHEKKVTAFTAYTDAKGQYTFTGVPCSSQPYYVQALLTEVQTNVLEYLPTTTKKAIGQYLSGSISSIPSSSGPDGTAFTVTRSEKGSETVYTADFQRHDHGKTVFDPANAQSVTLTSNASTAKFKDIGYVAGVPLSNQRNYEVIKEWGEGTTPQASITVELYYWDPDAGNSASLTPNEINGTGHNRRTGVLIDRVTLSAANNWRYTWKQLDNRRQYYFIEYYTKLKEDGTVMLNDRGEERLVLVGGTMPIYSGAPALGEEFYSMDTTEGTYNGHVITEEPKHFFGETVPFHPDATTQSEKRTNVDNNAMLYDVTYRLSVQDSTYITTFTNTQTYDEREYYVWLGHQRELPNFIAISRIDENGNRISDPTPLEQCDGLHDGHTDAFHLKGLTITSLDSYDKNEEGNSSDHFHYDPENPTSVYFTANDSIYHTGTGSRTYKVEYTVDRITGKPVAVKIEDGKPVPVDSSVSCYTYTWTLTIHVYDVKPDETFYYDPNGEAVTLQSGLKSSQKLTWQWEDAASDGSGLTSLPYYSDDPRQRVVEDGVISGDNGILGNDIYRVPMYKESVHHLMGSCADIVGIAYSPNGIIDDPTTLTFWDTNEGTNNTVRTDLAKDPTGKDYGFAGIGEAQAYGRGGTVDVELNTRRLTPISAGQDHLNYANISFTPNGTYDGLQGDVFYYKVVVFGEDISYNFKQYKDIDATQGVEMYAYFVVKPVDLLGDVVIHKTMTGNMYNPDDYFRVDVTFYSPRATTVSEPITQSGGYTSAFIPISDHTEVIPAYWSGEKTVSFWMQMDDYVVFSNLPGGMTYKIMEADCSLKGYSIPRYSYNRPIEIGDSLFVDYGWNNNYALGTVSDAEDRVTILNEKNASIDVGIETDDRPFFLLWTLVLLCGLTLLLRPARPIDLD